MLVCAAALSVSGCSSYPRLVTIPNVQAAPVSHAPGVDAALAEASSLQRDYATGYLDSAQIRDFSQLPLIGAAATAAWILLDARPNAARRTGRIGILAGAYSQARGQLVQANLTEIYIAGHAALTCVLAQGSYFSGTQAEARLATMNASLTRLNQAIVTTTSLIAKQPASGTTQALDLLRTTKAAAEQAIAQARTVASNAWSEGRAFEGAGPVFWQAVSAISSRVASRGSVRPGVDYRKLVAEFSPSGTAAQAGAGTRSAVQLTEELIVQMGILVGATAELRGVTPDYNARLEQIAGCPSQAG
jgi:hypothetical protein